MPRVSPEFRLRPSLSGSADARGDLSRRVSPEFRLRPSLSASSTAPIPVLSNRVAGVQTPAFVERPGDAPGSRSARGVSPEFRLRPSLSDCRARSTWTSPPVSPEFRLRPSLSDPQQTVVHDRGNVSPEFRLRPSLSVRRVVHRAAVAEGVAGVQTPAFVERIPAPSGGCRAGWCRRSSDSGLR